jgi:hypothetical protein
LHAVSLMENLDLKKEMNDTNIKQGDRLGVETSREGGWKERLKGVCEYDQSTSYTYMKTE